MFGLLFCRILLGLTFAAAAGSKIAGFDRFVGSVAQGIGRWQRLARPIALLVLLCECAVAICVLAPQSIAQAGFLLAVLLLLGFTALISVSLLRKQPIVCNCFGKGTEPVSPLTLVRNGILLVTASVGWWLSAVAAVAEPTYSTQAMLQAVLIAAPAVCVALLIVQLNQLVGLLRHLRA